MPEKIILELELNQGTSKEDALKMVKNIEGVKDAQEDLNDTIDETNDKTSELSQGIDKMTGGAISGFKESASGLKKLVKGTKAWKLALTGLLTLGIWSIIQGLSTYFNNSEEGQNRLAKATKQFGVILGNIGDVVANYGKVLIAVFVDRDLAKVKTAFKEFTDSIKNFGEETSKEIKIAGDLADRIAEVNKRERQLLVDRAKASGDLEKLRTKAAQVDKFTSEERIAFLEQAAAIETDINARQVALAQEKLDIKVAENALSGSTKEDLDEEAQLRAEVISLENQSLAVKREFYSQISGLRQADMDKRAAERQAELDGFKTLRAELDKELEKSVTKREKLEIGSNENVAESLKALKLKKKQDAKEEEELNEAVKDAKIAQGQQALAAITALAGEGSAIGKAAALASATISGIEGVQNAYTTAQKSPITAVFPAYPVIQAGLAGVFSALQIKSILSVPKPSKGGGASVASSTPRGAAASQPPAFNIVGASDQSQLAQTISGKEDKPVKAYVVSNDVTTAQGLDRNIVESASLG
jgi:hypothetical protein